MALTTASQRPLLRAAALLWPSVTWLEECITAHHTSDAWKNGRVSGMDRSICAGRTLHTTPSTSQQVQRMPVSLSASVSLKDPSSSISRQLLGSEMHKCNGQGRYEATVKVFQQFVGHAQEAAAKNGGKLPPEWQVTEEELLMYLDAIRKSESSSPSAAVQSAIETARKMGVRVGARSHSHYVKALCQEGKPLQAFENVKSMQQRGEEVDFETISFTVMALIADNMGFSAVRCGMFFLDQRTRSFKSALPEHRRLFLHRLCQTAADFRQLGPGHSLVLRAEELGEELAPAVLLELLGAAAEADDKLYCELFLSMLEKRRRLSKGRSQPPLQIPEGALLPVLNSACRMGDATLGVDAFNLLCESLSEPPWRPSGTPAADSWQPTPPSPYSFHAVIHALVNAAQFSPEGPERTAALNSAFNYLYQLEAAHHTQPRALSPRHGLAFFVEAIMYKPPAGEGEDNSKSEPKTGAVAASSSGTETETKGEGEKDTEGKAQVEGKAQAEEEEQQGGHRTRKRKKFELMPDAVLQVLKARRASGQMVTTSMLNVVLSARSRMAQNEDDMMKAAQLFDSFPTDFGVGHNIDSVNCLVKNAISTPAAVDALLRFIEDNGLQATADTYAEMMDSYILQSNVDGFLQAMRRSIKAGFEPSSTMLKQGLEMARKMNHRDAVRRLTVELQTLGVIPVSLRPQWNSPQGSEFRPRRDRRDAGQGSEFRPRRDRPQRDDRQQRGDRQRREDRQ